MDGMATYFLGVVVIAIMILAGMNAFFIRSLVLKIEQSSDAVKDLQKDMHYLREKVSSFSDMSKRLIDLEKRIAIMEYIKAND